MYGELLLVSAAILVVGAVVLWWVSLRITDASITDIAWGPAFAVLAAVGLVLGHGAVGRRVLVFVLVSLWATRLALYLAARRRRAGREDPRYAALRRRAGAESTPWRSSLFTVFLFQAALVEVVGIPVLASASVGSTLAPIDLVAVAMWCVGLGLETTADAQLSRFKADPANKGRLLRAGVWGWSRHPNYFGDALGWWGIGLLAVTGGVNPFVLVGPLVMTLLLVQVSGKRLLELRMGRRPGYAEYRAATSGFVPRPPKSTRSRDTTV
jgi:steroid 5-alpha reductase family enzyme